MEEARSFYPTKNGGHEAIVLYLLQKCNCQTFLELGIYQGDVIKVAKTFVKKCVGVDIVDHIGPNKKFTFIQKTTDEFFETNSDNFDAVFIDADHRYESAVKDLENSLKILNYNGFIIMHDTDPYKKEYLDPGYCGDSYKITQYVYDNHPELDIITLPVTEAGLTIIKRKHETRHKLYV